MAAELCRIGIACRACWQAKLSNDTRHVNVQCLTDCTSPASLVLLALAILPMKINYHASLSSTLANCMLQTNCDQQDHFCAMSTHVMHVTLYWWKLHPFSLDVTKLYRSSKLNPDIADHEVMDHTRRVCNQRGKH